MLRGLRKKRIATGRSSRTVGLSALIGALLLSGWSGCRAGGQAEAAEASGAVDTVAQAIRRARLVFAGDLMQHLPQVNAARRHDGTFDYSASLGYLTDCFRQADVAILNLETTLTPGRRYTGYPMFRSPAQLADALAHCGVDIALLANNHICDGGRTGIDFTTASLDALGIAYTGAFSNPSQRQLRHPLRFTAGGLRMALLNYTYSTNGVPVPAGAVVNLIDTVAIARDLATIGRDTTDCVIVCFHWGVEYARQPDRSQRQLADFCRRRGVELVIGSHPHVVQPVEAHVGPDSIVRAVTVFSLGNLVSNQRKRYCDGGLVVTIDLEKQPSDAALRIAPSYTPVWVKLPEYSILPPSVADTLPLSAAQQTAYRQFMNDTRKLLRYGEVFAERRF